MKLKILSLFDGISGAAQALKELKIDNIYYSCEIDKYAIQIAQKNHPNIIFLGNVKDCNVSGHFDLLIGGSPCQDLSIAKKERKGLEGERSGLFYEYVRILKEIKPRFFVLENVASMSRNCRDIITKELFNIEPIMINSSLLTAQQRKRLYWVGELQSDGSYKKVEIKQPDDKGILLKDILERGLPYLEKSQTPTATYNKAVIQNSLEKHQRTMIAEPILNSKYYLLQKEYKKRINNINVSFNKYLKDCKNLLSKTIIEIANYCNEPKTKIEHYFRLDNSRSIPSENTYRKLKQILNLDDRFDKLINETETLTANFEQNLRVYDINYKSPTLTSNKIKVLESMIAETILYNRYNQRTLKEKSATLGTSSGSATAIAGMVVVEPIRIGHYNKGSQGDRIYSVKGKSICLSANGGGGGAKTGLYKIDLPDGDYLIRKLTITECCRLQGFPDDYCSIISKTQAYKCLGNSFTVPVIKHILTTIINIK